LRALAARCLFETASGDLHNDQWPAGTRQVVDRSYLKVCAESVDPLAAWAELLTGGRLQPQQQ
jgi:hypothetical protein